MWENSKNCRERRAQCIGEVMRTIGILSQTKDPAATWKHTFEVIVSKYSLRITVTHRGGNSTSELEAASGERHGNGHLMDEFIAALAHRKGLNAKRNPQEQVVFFLDREYRLFD